MRSGAVCLLPETLSSPCGSPIEDRLSSVTQDFHWPVMYYMGATVGWPCIWAGMMSVIAIFRQPRVSNLTSVLAGIDKTAIFGAFVVDQQQAR
jgi:hypothetical protein